MVQFFSINTRVLLPPKDDLFRVLDDSSMNPLEEGDILMISSKILAIHQGRCVRKMGVDKLALIRQEADREICPIHDPCITIKDRALIPNSGIDESNGNGYYILWPHKVGELLRDIHQFFCQKFHIKKLGVLSVDSHVLPMRAGTVGISQASFGFLPTKNCIGERDIFGRELKISQINIADCLAGMSPILMGEGAECRPMVVARGVQGIDFCDDIGDLSIEEDKDLFRQIL